MNGNARLSLILTALLMLLVACNFSAPKPSPQPTAGSSVLFQDDFSDQNSGWDRVSEDGGQTDYLDGVYRVFVNKQDTDIWANPGLHFTDVSIQVDAVKAGGSDNNDFGLICRAMDPTHFYFLVISTDGYYGIGKVAGETQTLLGNESMQPSDKIAVGETSHHLQADCIADTLTLYVDGQKVAEVKDGDYPSGDVGLMAGSFDTPGTDIHFDNFSVQKPQQP